MYFKAPNQIPRVYQPQCQWGYFTRYLEIGEDLYPVRHVDVYANGHTLRYDRSHWVDDFGMLADMRYSSKWDEWWGSAEPFAWNTSGTLPRPKRAARCARLRPRGWHQLRFAWSAFLCSITGAVQRAAYFGLGMPPPYRRACNAEERRSQRTDSSPPRHR